MNKLNFYIQHLEKLTNKKVLLENNSLFFKAKVLSDKIRKKVGVECKDTAAGMCGIVSVYLWDALGKPQDFIPVYGNMYSSEHQGFPHVFLYNKKTNEYIDPTGDQFYRQGDIPFAGQVNTNKIHFDIEPLSQREIDGIKWEYEYDQEWRNNNK